MSSTTFDLDTAIGFVVNRTAYLMRRIAEPAFGAHDVTPEEWVILNRLWQEDGQRPAEIADTTIRDRSTVSHLLERMAAKGLVDRQRDERDRRAVRVWLTSRGRELEKVLVPLAEELLSILGTGISDARMRTTIDTLRQIQENLIAHEGGEE